MNNEENFFDRRTLIAIFIMLVTWFGWKTYIERKYPDYMKKEQQGQTAAPTTTSGDAPTAGTAAPAPATAPSTPEMGKPSAPETPVQTASPEKVIHYESPTIAFDISSKGMGLKNYRTLKFRDRKGDVVDIGANAGTVLPLETRLLGSQDPLEFTIEKVNDNLFVGHAQVGDLAVTKSMEIDPERYLLTYKVSATGQNPKFVGLSTGLAEQVETATKDFQHPQLERQEFYVDMADTHDRVAFDKNDLNSKWSRVKLASIGSQYFTQAVMDKSDIMPEAKAHLDHSRAVAHLFLDYPVLNAGGEFKLDYNAFLGPKSYGLLRSIDPELASVVDYGRWAFIARHIFELLRWFYSLVGNWGVAIICLTFVLRLLVLPFNVYSYKSMRAMQAIQPQLKELKERYKDDQQKASAETMRVMREHKVNPLGGCLPVLIQIPVFFALYQMLGHTVELYQAPFALWIHDLSLKDPYYILPVLMGVTMFVQQKTTPNPSLDPAQARMMMMMPLIFTFFMISLPSGLALYMLVGSLFSVVQQTYFMRKAKTPG